MFPKSKLTSCGRALLGIGMRNIHHKVDWFCPHPMGEAQEWDYFTTFGEIHMCTYVGSGSGGFQYMAAPDSAGHQVCKLLNSLQGLLRMLIHL